MDTGRRYASVVSGCRRGLNRKFTCGQSLSRLRVITPSKLSHGGNHSGRRAAATRRSHLHWGELRRAVDDNTGKTWYDLTSQAFAVFLPVKSVGVMGDGRTYEWVVSLRRVSR